MWKIKVLSVLRAQNSDLHTGHTLSWRQKARSALGNLGTGTVQQSGCTSSWRGPQLLSSLSAWLQPWRGYTGDSCLPTSHRTFPGCVMTAKQSRRGSRGSMRCAHSPGIWGAFSVCDTRCPQPATSTCPRPVRKESSRCPRKGTGQWLDPSRRPSDTLLMELLHEAPSWGVFVGPQGRRWCVYLVAAGFCASCRYLQYVRAF